MPNMRAFCFVSTAYVNANLPKGSTVEEKVYPLHDHGVPVDHATMVQHLMSLNLTAAEAEVCTPVYSCPDAVKKCV